jgi:MarR family transcriptional regulator, organic hydroperoxide resistance regulator
MNDVAVIEEAVELLPLISRRITSAIASDPGMASLTVTQAKAIALLYHEGEKTISDVASGLGIGLPAASELVDRLEERGLVTREQDPRDRRRFIIDLTDEAMAFATRIHDLRRRQVRAALSRLPESDWPVFLASLRALAQALDESTPIDSDDRASSTIAGIAVR